MSLQLVGELKSSPMIKRYENNPIMTSKDVPFKSELVFNSSVIKHKGRYVMVFRNDYQGEGRWLKNFGIAYSDDGIHFEVGPEPIMELRTEEIRAAYDPRLTVIDDQIYMTFTTGTRHGVRAALIKTDDFKHFEWIDYAMPDSRNNLLFPEKINGMYYRLERPFWSPVDDHSIRTGEWVGRTFDIFISRSPDLRYWGDNQFLIGTEHIPYANIKIGGGPVPIKTPKGWLVLIHAVDHDPSRGKNGMCARWTHRYSAGAMLLDLNDPSKVIGLSRQPLLAPEAEYETSGGFRNDVVFPTAAIVEDDGQVKIYYGAADAFVCLATAHIDDLLKVCEPFENA